MSLIEVVTIGGVLFNLLTLLISMSKLIGFFTRLESRLTKLEVLYDSIEKRKNRGK